jgi:hypothetical protein
MPLQIITLFIQGLPCGSLSSCIRNLSSTAQALRSYPTR